MYLNKKILNSKLLFFIIKYSLWKQIIMFLIIYSKLITIYYQLMEKKSMKNHISCISYIDNIEHIKVLLIMNDQIEQLKNSIGNK
jgi:hypothetical protein